MKPRAHLPLGVSISACPALKSLSATISKNFSFVILRRDFCAKEPALSGLEGTYAIPGQVHRSLASLRMTSNQGYATKKETMSP